MDIVFGLIGFVLGLGIGKNMSHIDPTKAEEELKEQNNKLIEDIDYYKKLCRTISEENAEFRRKQK